MTKWIAALICKGHISNKSLWSGLHHFLNVMHFCLQLMKPLKISLINHNYTSLFIPNCE